MKNAASFPMWVFQKKDAGGGKKLVQDQAELDALGHGWYDSPAGQTEGVYIPPASMKIDHAESYPKWITTVGGERKLIKTAEEDNEPPTNYEPELEQMANLPIGMIPAMETPGYSGLVPKIGDTVTVKKPLRYAGK